MTTTLTQTSVQTAEIDARAILAHVLCCTSDQLYLHTTTTLQDDQIAECNKLVTRRTNNEPIQYITNHAEFMSLPFYVDTNVLIPRPDTETLVETIIANVGANPNLRLGQAQPVRPIVALDLCTGSGCIAVSLAHYIPNLTITATDISPTALIIARKNAVTNKVSKRITFIQSDIFAALDATHHNKYDFIVSNPPYITASEMKTLAPNVHNYEPHTALHGGKDGLNFYRIIAQKAKQYLKPGAPLFLEIGCEQAQSVTELLHAEGFINVTITKDLAGLDRVVVGTAAPTVHNPYERR